MTVCPNGCDSTTIQGAVTMADPGDTIQILSSGEHTEADIWISKDITISGFGPLVTVIQADPVMATSTLPVFVVVNGANVSMESLKIRHGGGGLFVDQGASATVSHSTVEGNQALYGGGVRVGGDGPTHIFNSTISATVCDRIAVTWVPTRSGRASA